MTALVIGLLIATAASSYVMRRGEFTQMSANLVLLDRELAHYRPETKECAICSGERSPGNSKLTWSEPGSSPHAKFDPSAGKAAAEKPHPKTDYFQDWK